MNQIVKTENHPNKKRKILGPIGRFLLKLVSWDIVGDLPDKKRVGYKKTKAEIFANYDDISIAVKNLIKNALKYSPLEENIFIKTEMSDSEIICSFQDFGSGISKADQEKIFERFYRVDKGRSRKLGGTGLGLAIVKHAIDRNNARIEIESKLSFGSTFSIIFPKVNVK